MDEAARRAEFARNIAESDDIMGLMRVETRTNAAAVASSRIAIAESLVILKRISRAILT